MISRKTKYLFVVLATGFLCACQQPEPTSQAEAKAESKPDTSNEVSLEMNVSDSLSEGVTASSEGISFANAGWAAYSVEMPETGRYRVTFSVNTKSDSTQVWVEDHVDNVDGRTYNITSNIAVPMTEEIEVVHRDGSPMREGNHKIKVHATGPAEISKLTFELIRKHQVTPETYTQNMEGDDWELVWSDEFDGSGLPDTSKWVYDVGDWGWGNGELQYYTVARSENARLEDGNLIIEAHKNDMGSPWTSARLTTRGKSAFVYGKIEFRAKVPAEKGNWAAGWTLGDEYVDEKSWPYCGEIDILESVGYEMDNETGNGIAHASAHCGAYYFKLGNQPTGIINVKSMEDDFHTYGVIWTSEYIEAYVDDEIYFRYDDNSSELSWPFSKPQALILNLAMGGGWGGLMGMDESVESQKMVVDYVRVYQRKTVE